MSQNNEKVVDPRKGIRTLERAINANPNDPFAWYSLGVRCYTNHCHLEALECFEKAESIKKNFSAANRYHIALCQRELGRTKECLDSLKATENMTAINAVDKKARVLASKVLKQMEVTTTDNTTSTTKQ